MRQPTKNDDIDGSKPGTLKGGVQTNRVGDPLNPVYQYPGCGEKPTFEVNDPYGKAGCSMAARPKTASVAGSTKPPKSVGSVTSAAKPPCVETRSI